MSDASVSTAEFIRHFGRYHDQAMKEPITLTKHGRETVVVIPVERYRRIMESLAPQRAYGPGEMPRELADMFLSELDKDSVEFQATDDD